MKPHEIPSLSNAKRIYVLGCAGSGKSTTARKLHKILKLPVAHLDVEYWKPGWVEPTDAEWRIHLKKLVSQKTWIMDGSHVSRADITFPEADIIIFLNVPRYKCLWRVIKRRIVHRKTPRSDIPVHCPERLTWKFLKWIWNYDQTKTQRIFKAVEVYSHDHKFFVIKNNSELHDLLSN
ncbi:MAG: AAA family ATPase [Alphaproteobacteria bacterium]|nr:AAA family ATPase [Alphaproteobacteria bacterium]MBT5389419.1 AAA family ATPase [Alphaproteobacteria bacterium]MBT5540023.1 AAA family ATPase [Alphaproteobacteria bacterium]MBT5654476.1 AAA family ATPase [Alphaproteobacteria bacterium]